MNCSYGLCDTSTADSILHDDNNENNSDVESERDDNSPEEISDLTTSSETNQQNLSLTKDAETDTMNVSSNSYLDVTSNTPSQSCRNTPINSSIITNIENTILSNNNDFEDQCLNNNINESIDAGSLLDSPPESVNSKGRRYCIFIYSAST